MDIHKSVLEKAYFMWLETGCNDAERNYYNAIDYIFAENVHICSICTKRCEQPKFLPCKHFFCRNCINAWLDITKQCPMCSAFKK